jgi:hypothetical protein
VFAPFHRGVEGVSNGKGIGLGLAITKSLVEKMGGSIAIVSTLGLGSVFVFDLTFDLASRTDEPRRFSQSPCPLPSPLPTRAFTITNYPQPIQSPCPLPSPLPTRAFEIQMRSQSLEPRMKRTQSLEVYKDLSASMMPSGR